jgi:hypothetical protein
MRQVLGNSGMATFAALSQLPHCESGGDLVGCTLQCTRYQTLSGRGPFPSALAGGSPPHLVVAGGRIHPAHPQRRGVVILPTPASDTHACNGPLARHWPFGRSTPQQVAYENSCRRPLLCASITQADRQQCSRHRRRHAVNGETSPATTLVSQPRRAKVGLSGRVRTAPTGRDRSRHSASWRVPAG